MVWDQASGAAPRQLDFRHGSLNDLQFSPDSTCSRSQPEIWAYTPLDNQPAPGFSDLMMKTTALSGSAGTDRPSWSSLDED